MGQKQLHVLQSFAKKPGFRTKEVYVLQLFSFAALP